jgi:hypothetical protein
MRFLVVIAILFCWVSAAGADIIEWQDADGVFHYTNLKGEIPKDQEGSTRVVVDELVRQPANTGATPAVADPAPEAANPRPEADALEARVQAAAQARTQALDAYVRGLQQGLDAITGTANGGGSEVQINGPLVVTQGTNPAPYADGYFPGYYPVGYYPFAYYAVAATPRRRELARPPTFLQRPRVQSVTEREIAFLFHQQPVSAFGTPRCGADLSALPGLGRTTLHRSRR